MKVLLDECLPKRLKRELPGHDVIRVQEMGWAGIKNGALIRLIQAADFEVLVTIAGNIEYQQNLRAINFAIIVLGASDNTFDTLRPLMPQVIEALKKIKVGEVVHINA
jgi:predicted nuclease of predicted toxin-antitoxin system